MFRLADRSHVVIAFTLVLTAATFGSAAPAAPEGLPERVAHVKTYLERLAAHGAFDGAVLIAHGPEVLLERGFGEADRENDVPWTPAVVSTVGSITKQFTAAGIALLAQDGRLSFEDPITKYLAKVPEDKAAITVHHCLTHSAGFAGAVGADNEYVDRDALLERAFARPLLFAPGAQYAYSNVGYSILAAIIETISGETYETFMRSRFFAPLSMNDTGYVQPNWDAGRLAIGYRGDQRWGTVVGHQDRRGFTWNLIGNGGMHTTVGDMHRWWLSLRNATVLKRASVEALLAPYIDEGFGDSAYGYGWSIQEAVDGSPLITHNGGNGYIGADCAFFPEQDVFAVLIVNDLSQSRDIGPDVYGVLAGAPLILPPAVDADLEGVDDTLRRRARAYVEAFNAGPDAYVAFAGEHRVGGLGDADVQAARRAQAADLHERWGTLEITDGRTIRPGMGVLDVRGANGSRVQITFTVEPEPPYRLARIGLEMRDGDDGDDPRAALDAAKEMLAAGRRAEAKAVLRTLVAAHPDFPEAWFRLGYAELTTGENDASVGSFEHAMELGFEPHMCLYNVACAHAKEGRIDPALTALEGAVTAGFRMVDALEQDPDLATLRETARFRAVLARVRSDG